MNEPVIVIDFETTGLMPGYDRVIEAAAVRVENGVITARFQSLANPGRRISAFIENFTGISNAMVAQAPPVAQVMHAMAEFVGSHRLAAHNASFDRGFLTAELHLLKKTVRQDFLCTLLLSRRIARGLPGYKLEQVARHFGLQLPARTHRALADAELAAQLLLALQKKLQDDLSAPQITPSQLFRAQGIQPARFGRHMSTLLE